MGHLSQYKQILANKVKEVRAALASPLFNLESLKQNLPVMADLVNKNTEKQFVLPNTGRSVTFVSAFWKEMLELAELTAQTSLMHQQALQLVRTLAAKYIVADVLLGPEGESITGTLQKEGHQGPPSPKKRSQKRSSRESEKEASCLLILILIFNNKFN